MTVAAADKAVPPGDKTPRPGAFPPDPRSISAKMKGCVT